VAQFSTVMEQVGRKGQVRPPQICAQCTCSTPPTDGWWSRGSNDPLERNTMDTGIFNKHTRTHTSSNDTLIPTGQSETQKRLFFDPLADSSKNTFSCLITHFPKKSKEEEACPLFYLPSQPEPDQSPDKLRFQEEFR